MKRETLPSIGAVRLKAVLEISTKISSIMLTRMDTLTVVDINHALDLNEMLGVALRRISSEVTEVEYGMV